MIYLRLLFKDPELSLVLIPLFLRCYQLSLQNRILRYKILYADLKTVYYRHRILRYQFASPSTKQS